MYIVCENHVQKTVGCANLTSGATNQVVAARWASRPVASADRWRKAGAVAAVRAAVGAPAAVRPDAADAAVPGVAAEVAAVAVAAA